MLLSNLTLNLPEFNTLIIDNKVYECKIECNYPPIYHQFLATDNKIKLLSLRYYNSFIKYKNSVMISCNKINNIKNHFGKNYSEQNFNHYQYIYNDANQSLTCMGRCQLDYYTNRNILNSEIMSLLPTYFKIDNYADFTDFLNKKLKLDIIQLNSLHRFNYSFRNEIMKVIY